MEWLLLFAYFFAVNSRVNITLGPNEDREFTTGLHIVNDIYCICCQENIGWRYWQRRRRRPQTRSLPHR
uniref:Yippee domain-containing protein n=1 Tax=Setaria italica TaxID=4555 RepID=K3YF02_SETIT